jgi:hypothetical protein
MRLTLLLIIMSRMRLLRLRYGITFTGMTLASGRGVFLGVIATGLEAILTGQKTVPPFSVSAAAMGMGAVSGLIYGLIPRRPRFGICRRPTARRVGGFAVIGTLSAPVICAYGQPPAWATAPYDPAMGWILLSGCVGVARYLVAQRRRGLRHQYGLPPIDQPVLPLARIARGWLAKPTATSRN